uniref:Apple domain-containing protein n=1 Tax=Globodera pallida TaxID=36090 RepID=A0A183CQJ0_GLOPA
GADEENNTVKQEQKQLVLNRPDIAFCEGSVSAFFVSDNVSVRGANASVTIFESNEKQCANLCAENRDNRGRSLLCGSALYENDTRQCKLYRKASAPDGELKRFAADGRRYFEKFCLTDDLPADCAFTHFLRVDDHILKG